MTKMTKKERFKKFTKDNADLIAAAAYFTAAAGVVVVIAKEFKRINADAQLTVAHYNTWAEGENEWIAEQTDAGRSVFYLHDGTYATIPADVESEWIKDRPKHP